MRSLLSFLLTVFALGVLAPLTGWAQAPQERSVAAEPGFARFQLWEGDEGTQSLIIYSNETEPFKVLDVTSPVSWITVKFRKATAAERVEKGNATNTQYRVDISIDSSAARILSERIKVTTNSPTTPEILLPVSGMVRHRLSPAQTLGANHNEGRISATIVDAAGFPIAGAKVALTYADGRVYDAPQTTDTKGGYHIVVLDATKPYKIHIEKPGYISIDDDVKLKLGETLNITYTLKPVPQP